MEHFLQPGSASYNVAIDPSLGQAEDSPDLTQLLIPGNETSQRGGSYGSADEEGQGDAPVSKRPRYV